MAVVFFQKKAAAQHGDSYFKMGRQLGKTMINLCQNN